MKRNQRDIYKSGEQESGWKVWGRGCCFFCFFHYKTIPSDCWKRWACLTLVKKLKQKAKIFFFTKPTCRFEATYECHRMRDVNSVPSWAVCEWLSGSSQVWLHGLASCEVTDAPRYVSCSAVAVLKFLLIWKQGASHFHFAPGPANYVASPASNRYTVGILAWLRMLLLPLTLTFF